MTEAQRFLLDKRNAAGNQYAHANGNRQMTPFAHANGGGSLANTPGMRQSRYGFAGGGVDMPSGVKQYIIQIANSNTSAASNVSILGASTYLNGAFGGATWLSNGSLQFASGVVISAVSGATTYQQILSSFMSAPVAVGAVYMKTVGSSSNTQQVADTYTITSVSPSGERYSADKFPIISPTQFQLGISYNNDDFNVDSLTTMTWGTVYASTTFQISLYIASIVNPANAISGQNVQQNYGAPTNLSGIGGY
jgi:hypothetical protein